MEKSEFYRDARRDLTGPLDGVRVIDATTSWAGPMCACMLADLGADVIKVEAPDGEVARRIPPGSAGHMTRKSDSRTRPSIATSAASRSISARDEGREVFLKLARAPTSSCRISAPARSRNGASVTITFAPVKPDIIYVSISGYGQFGPIHDRVAYDPLAQAMGGFVSLNGSPDGPPIKAPTWLCDDLGGLHGAIGALAALRHRDHTGEGSMSTSRCSTRCCFSPMAI